MNDMVTLEVGYILVEQVDEQGPPTNSVMSPGQAWDRAGLLSVSQCMQCSGEGAGVARGSYYQASRPGGRSSSFIRSGQIRSVVGGHNASRVEGGGVIHQVEGLLGDGHGTVSDGVVGFDGPQE